MQSVYTIGQVNSYIKNMFEQDYLLKQICVKGEVSNCKYHSSGHIYFTLKDQDAAIACVMFSGNRKGLDFQMKDGQQVIADGSIEVYQKEGKFQLYARKIRKDGVGDLYERFEALKRKLSEEGLFSNEYKRPLPVYVQKLGVATAPTGAAVRDIITVSKRRNPYIQIVLYPVTVQGENAAESIVKGIQALERYGVDIIIVGRGGGSIEDLWAFNEESVAQAIFQSEVPVISAVGHETDFTIADFVADQRAATPSAAAELAVNKMSDLLEQIDMLSNRLLRDINMSIEYSRRDVMQWNLRLKNKAPMNRLREQRVFLLNLEERLSKSMLYRISESRNKYSIMEEILKRVSPQAKLDSGYCLVTDTSGKCINDASMLNIGDHVLIQMKNGVAVADINDIKLNKV